jgi:hypothetical protein
MGVFILSDIEFGTVDVWGTCYQVHATIPLDKRSGRPSGAGVYNPTSTAYDTPMARPQPRPLTSIRDLIAKSDFARLNPGRTAEILDRCSDPLTEDRPDIRKELVNAPAR